MTEELDIDALSAAVTKQGSAVRQLKKDGAPSDEIAAAVADLQKLKISVETARKALEASDPKEVFNKKTFDELILRKMFVVPSFEIHGGVKGLFDLGPPACALKVSYKNYSSQREFYILTIFLLFVCVWITLNFA